MLASQWEARMAQRAWCHTLHKSAGAFDLYCALLYKRSPAAPALGRCSLSLWRLLRQAAAGRGRICDSIAVCARCEATSGAVDGLPP